MEQPWVGDICWGRRDEGIDALQAILKRMPHLRNTKTDGVKIGKDKHDNVKRDPTKRFWMGMDFLSNVFGIRNRACHTGEAIVMSAFIRFITKWDRQFGPGMGMKSLYLCVWKLILRKVIL